MSQAKQEKNKIFLQFTPGGTKSRPLVFNLASEAEREEWRTSIAVLSFSARNNIDSSVIDLRYYYYSGHSGNPSKTTTGGNRCNRAPWKIPGLAL
jgi:hypothetical protein